MDDDHIRPTPHRSLGVLLQLGLASAGLGVLVGVALSFHQLASPWDLLSPRPYTHGALAPLGLAFITFVLATVDMMKHQRYARPALVFAAALAAAASPFVGGIAAVLVIAVLVISVAG